MECCQFSHGVTCQAVGTFVKSPTKLDLKVAEEAVFAPKRCFDFHYIKSVIYHKFDNSPTRHKA